MFVVQLNASSVRNKISVEDRHLAYSKVTVRSQIIRLFDADTLVYIVAIQS